MTVIFVLPAYDEAENLGSLLDNVKAAMGAAGLAYKIVVIDDGSKDPTYAVARRYAEHMPIVIEQNMPNQGLAAALRKGFIRAAALAAPDDVIVTMDADNTHTPAQVPQLLAALQPGVDVVVASRYRRGAEIYGLSASRKALSRGAALLFQIFFPMRGVRDYTCGYRACRAELLQRALRLYGDDFVSERGFSCVADTLLKLNRLGGRVAEIPLVLRYDLKQGRSKMAVVRTTLQTLWLLVRRRLSIGIVRA
ncbi:MAG TPA: glycosyltransferase [Candidatus Binatia bacterium]